MHVVITGAAGFVGQGLSHRLGRDLQLAGRALTRLSLLDLSFGDARASEGIVHRLSGDLADSAWLGGVLGEAPVDVVFHLASLPGGAAEADPALARRVNVDATWGLLDHCKAQVHAGGTPPVFVFASSIAVFGAMQHPVSDDTLPRPLLSYGAHKLIGEVLVDDHSRRGWVDGRSLRLPGVLVRPPAPTGQLSAFLSDIIRELAAHRPFVCPMSPGAATWASSLPNVVDNLAHAACADAAALQGRRTFTLPTLHFSMQALVDAIAEVHGVCIKTLVQFQPQERMEALFGRFPALDARAALAAGFASDGDLATLVRRAFDKD